MRTNRVNRLKRGSTLLEFGPSLGLLLLGLFGLIGLCCFAFVYFACLTLNDLQCQKAAEVPKRVAKRGDGIVQCDVVRAWRSSGLGRFVPLVQAPDTTVTYEKSD